MEHCNDDKVSMSEKIGEKSLTSRMNKRSESILAAQDKRQHLT